MTFLEKIQEMMRERGMLDSQIHEVMPVILDTKELAMVGRWEDDIDGYPEIGINLLWRCIQPIVYEWLQENAPNAWFLMVFAPRDEQDKFMAENSVAGENGPHKTVVRNEPYPGEYFELDK